MGLKCLVPKKPVPVSASDANRSVMYWTGIVDQYSTIVQCSAVHCSAVPYSAVHGVIEAVGEVLLGTSCALCSCRPVAEWSSAAGNLLKCGSVQYSAV